MEKSEDWDLSQSDIDLLDKLSGGFGLSNDASPSSRMIAVMERCVERLDGVEGVLDDLQLSYIGSEPGVASRLEVRAVYKDLVKRIDDVIDDWNGVRQKLEDRLATLEKFS